MKLEERVCSVELAKRLKELGVKQESYFSWLFWNDGEGERSVVITDRARVDVWEITERDKVGKCISAFTVAELGEMLKECWTTWKLNGRWNAGDVADDGLIPASCIGIQTEADARAKMLIYLLENKLIILP